MPFQEVLSARQRTELEERGKPGWKKKKDEPCDDCKEKKTQGKAKDKKQEEVST